MTTSARKAFIAGFLIGTGLMWGAIGVPWNAIAHFVGGAYFVWQSRLYARQDRS